MTTISLEQPARERPSIFKTTLRFTMTVAVIGLIVAAGWKLNREFGFIDHLCTTTFILATFLAVVYRLINPVGWAIVLNGIGGRVKTLMAVRVWLYAESRRWLPGGVWGYTSRAMACKELGVTTKTASASMVVELFLTLVAAACVSAVGVFSCSEVFATTVRGVQTKLGANYLQIAGVAFGLVLLTVVVFSFRDKLVRKFKAELAKFKVLLHVKFDKRALVKATLFLIGMACLNGLVNQVLVPVVDAAGQVPLVAMIGATSAAWIVGFFAFFSPGGILVREAALATLLLPWLSYDAGLMLAVLSRVAQLIAEIVGMFALLVLPRNSQSN